MLDLPEWTDPFCWSTMNEPWTGADEIIEEIREIRMRLSARFDHDIHKYGAYLMERQKRHGDRLIDPETWPTRKAAREVIPARPAAEHTAPRRRRALNRRDRGPLRGVRAVRRLSIQATRRAGAG